MKTRDKEMIVKEMLVVDNVSDRLAEIDKLVYSMEDNHQKPSI